MTVPVGFAPIFTGWNVWDLWQSDQPPFSIMELGESADRRLQVWVENAASAGNGAAIADPANPFALRGDQVQPIPSPSGLKVAATREDIPALAGNFKMSDDPTKTATLRTVRFYNRGVETSIPWPHDEELLLNVVYQPTAQNPLTGGPAPSSLAGTATSAGDSAVGLVKVAGYGVGAFLVFKLIELLRGK